LIKESGEIEKRRRLRLENQPIVAQVRKEQFRKDVIKAPVVKNTLELPAPKSNLPIIRNPVKSNLHTAAARKNLQLPVKKPNNSSARKSPPPVEVKKEEEPKELSIFAQIKKALQSVPERIKDILSFGHTSEASKLKRAQSIEFKSPAIKITSSRRSSYSGQSSVRAHEPKPDRTLHDHNAKVEATLGKVLMNPPTENVKKEASMESLKAPKTIQRNPISWRNEQEIDRLKSKKEEHLPPLNKVPSIRIARPSDASTKLPPISKQPETFDPIKNPYRSAGRKFSPIVGWPCARSFNPEVGRCKIIDYIEQVGGVVEELMQCLELGLSKEEINLSSRTPTRCPLG
jgi:hypothetical protein